MPKKQPKKIGLAIVGAGRVGLIRGELAARHPEVEWIGIAEKNPERAQIVAEKVGADFVTQDFRELLARPEVNAAVIATDELAQLLQIHTGDAVLRVARLTHTAAGIPLDFEYLYSRADNFQFRLRVERQA